VRTFYKSLAKNTEGASLIEFTLIFPLLMVMTFGIVEFGYVLYQHNIAQKATQIGARFAATRAPIVPNLPDCVVATPNNTLAGTDCSSISGSSGISAAICQNGGGAGCDTTAMARLLQEMQKVYPQITAANLRVEFAGTGFGYVGRGRPVPAITVSLENLQYDYVVMGKLIPNFGATTLNLDTAKTTLVAEDLGEGRG